MTDAIAFVDGALVPRAEATVSIDDASVRYGAACFETMRATNGHLFRFAAHLARLCGGLSAMGIEAPSADFLTAAVASTLEANALLDARVRLSVSAGRMLGPDLAIAGPPSVIIVADPMGAEPAAPLTLAVSSFRVDAARPLALAKTTHYLVYLLARAEAREQGADDALLLNADGDVCEAATANLFAVIAGRLVTPALNRGPLPGVTRSVILEIAARIGMPAAERALTADQLAQATEIFTTNSIVGTQPVTSIAQNGEPLWANRSHRQATDRLAAEYALLVASECGGGNC